MIAQNIRGLFGLAAISVALLGAAPSHVPTSDYWAGYAGTKAVPADVASHWLTWAETNPDGSKLIHPFGVKTILYTDPNRQIENHDTMWSNDESTLAHDCSGNRLEARRKGQFQMDVRSPHLRDLWKRAVSVRWNAGQFDAILNDDANNLEYLSSQPCGMGANDWLRATSDLQGAVGYPVIYNGLEAVHDNGVPPAIALNKTAIGGMMEQCYAASPRIPRQGDWKWRAAENVELQMAHEGKYFFCYNNDTSPADQSTDNRLYVYASYLLSYDPRNTVLWEYYMTPTRAHVMPEVQFVPFDPVKPAVKTIDDLKNRDGVYVREYSHCYLNGQIQGKCMVAVNPDNSDHHINLSGYGRQLTVSGSGIFDGGKAQIQGRSMPDTLPARSAIIAVR